MFGFFKLIIVFIVGLIILGASFFTSIFTNSAVSKDSAMNTYNNFLQDVSSLGITSDNKIISICNNILLYVICIARQRV